MNNLGKTSEKEKETQPKRILSVRLVQSKDRTAVHVWHPDAVIFGRPLCVVPIRWRDGSGRCLGKSRKPERTTGKFRGCCKLIPYFSSYFFMILHLALLVHHVSLRAPVPS